MWEAISSILTASHGVPIAILFVVLIVIILIGAKHKIVVYKGSKLKIGADRKNERDILTKQLSYAQKFIESRFSLLNQKTLRYEGYMAKYILEVAYDLVITWIMFNHMSMNDSYVESKQKEMIYTIYSVDDLLPEYKTEKFKQTVFEWVKDLIKELIDIRQRYTE